MVKEAQKAKMTKLHNLLQICARAGQLKTGYDTVSKLVSQRRARVVIMAEDFSERNKIRIIRNCKDAGVPVYILGTMTGYSGLFSKRAIGILMTSDRNFASGLSKILKADTKQATEV